MTDPIRALDQARQDRLATYVGDTMAKVPWWYHVGLGLASGLAVAGGGITPRWLGVAMALVGAAAIGALVGWWTRRAGAIPRLRNMPRPLRNVLITYWVVFAVVVGSMLIWAFVSQSQSAFVRAAVVQLLVVSVGGILTDHWYARRAQALAEREGLRRG